MYESFFGLQERPFPSAPLTSAWVATEAAEYARKQLERCLERGEGVGLLIGGAGTGKTQLLQVLAQRFENKFHVAKLTSASLCTRRALLQSILYELHLPYRSMEEGELRLSLIDHLRPSRECPHGMLLLIDEAHALPLRLLEEVRLITNLSDQGTPRVRLVLAGTLAFEERMASPKLAAFNQRVAARCYLHAMKQSETSDYVRQQLKRVGARGAAIFTDAALRAIHTATDGIPRLVNQLCDHALLLAATGEQRSIDTAGIQEAWSDLQQLPTPWNETNKPVPAVVEFGALDDLEPAEPIDPLETVERSFDDLQLKLADLHLNDEQDDDTFEFQPAGSGTEVEISRNELREIFGEGFDDEEIVIDRFAALDARSINNRLHVSTREGVAFSVEIEESPSLPKPQLKVVASEVTLSIETTAPAFPEKLEINHLAEEPIIPIDSPSIETSLEAPSTLQYPNSFHVTQEYDPVYPEAETSPEIETITTESATLEISREEQSAVPRPNTLSEMFRKRRPAFQKLFANLRKSK